MSTAPSRPVVVSALATGALWVVTGWVGFALAQSGGTVSRVASIIPATVPRSLWSWPAAWAVVTIALGTAGVMVWYALYLAILRRRDAASVDLVTAWFAVIAAAATIGFAIDVTVVIGAVPLVGLLAFTSGYGGSAAVGAFWGLIAGWMPALLASRMRRAAEPAVPRRAWLGLAAAVTLVAFIAAGVFGYQAFRIQIAEEAALAQGVTPDDGALPDPYAQGDPVPTAAPASEDLAGVTCTPEQATLLLGEQDAATGHRVLSIRLLNFSEEPCVIEGYIDVAFGDQNEHELAVTIEPGSSFMAADPGPQRIEVPAGGHAIAYLGWDAASPHGALVARSLHAAPIAGMTRGSWPVETDIVEGSTVEVTAWQLDGPPGSE